MKGKETENRMKIRNLQVNHLTKPVGISGKNLRLSWNLEGGKKQNRFEVTVKDTEGNVLGIVEEESNAMVCILKKEIPSRTKVKICVKVWDEEKKESEPAGITVVTGINKEEWNAKWIDPELEDKKKENRRASYLRKRFSLTRKQMETAEQQGAYIYATCHGIMNLFINGEEITNHQFMPGTQQYDKRLMVETLEVTQFLREGENEIMVSLGDGWYRGAMGFSQNKNIYGTDLALLLQFEIAREPIVVSDGTWTATQDGPIGENDFMAGEVYDARKEFPMEHGLMEDCGERFHLVKVQNYGMKQLIPVDTVPVTPHETLFAKQIITPAGEVVLDFGQNIVGYVSFEFDGQEGKKLTLIHGEVLDGKGNFTIENFQNKAVPTRQQIDYICREGRNKYHPTKTYMGFRYVKVEAAFEIDPAAFRAVAVYSDIRTTAEFSCGVSEVNQLFQNALWSMKGNFIDVPTDCPTREKSGYSGDCQAYIHTAMYLMDCYPVYAKWIREQAAGQYKDGVVPQIAPKANTPGEKEKIGGVLTTDGGIGWSDSFEIVPYRLMKRYGDDALVRENYEAMKRWTAYEIKRAQKTRFCNCRLLPRKYRKYMIDTEWMWGEWLEPGQDVNYMSNIVMKGDPEVGTAFYYMNLNYMAQMAEILGEDEDQQYYKKLAEKAKEAYRIVYLENGSVKEKTRQCRYVRPIAHDLLSEKEKTKAASDLAEMIERNENHLNTGFLTTHELSRSLSQYGQNKKAYDLLLQEEKPGWLFAVTKGCTTIPESWDCYDEEGNPHDSFNHYSYGAVAGWLMDCVCGINVSDGKIVIQPYPDERLRFAAAAYDSPYGKIVSEWKYEEGKVKYHVEIPTNMCAEILIDGREKMSVEAGVYEL